MINLHQRCGYSDSPFARVHYFYTAGSRNGFEGMDLVFPGTENKLTLSKTYIFVFEKYVEDVTHDEKHVLDLLEAIMRPTFFVKGQLRKKCSKSINLDPKY